MDLATLPARERILVTAHDLFYRDGVRATGIDRVIAEAGVTKVTFYRHFPSKDDLVRAFLDYRHERWMAWFVDALGRHGAESGNAMRTGRLEPLAAALAEWFAAPGFRGCAFINAVAEVGAAVAEAQEISHRHKEDMEQVIAELLPAGPQRDALALAAALAVDGCIVRAQMGEAASALQGLRLALAALEPFAEGGSRP